MAKLQDRIVGHPQITDAYLLALAMHHRSKLATLDKGIRAWGMEAAIEVIGYGQGQGTEESVKNQRWRTEAHLPPTFSTTLHNIALIGRNITL